MIQVPIPLLDLLRKEYCIIFINVYAVLVTPLCLFVTPWTIAHKAPLSMEFSRQKYWSRFPFLSPGHLLDPGIEPGSPVL